MIVKVIAWTICGVSVAGAIFVTREVAKVNTWAAAEFAKAAQRQRDIHESFKKSCKEYDSVLNDLRNIKS